MNTGPGPDRHPDSSPCDGSLLYAAYAQAATAFNELVPIPWESLSQEDRRGWVRATQAALAYKDQPVDSVQLGQRVYAALIEDFVPKNESDLPPPPWRILPEWVQTCWQKAALVVAMFGSAWASCQSPHVPQTGGLWRKEGNGKGKFRVRRRDGSIPEYDCFVLGARDPSAAVALRAYADDAASRGRHPSYVADVRQLAREFEAYALAHGASQPDEQPTREDDPALVAKIAEGAAGKAPSDSFPTVSEAKAVIQAHIGPANLMMGDPWYDPEDKEWKARVSLSRSGPLVRMGFKIAKVP